MLEYVVAVVVVVLVGILVILVEDVMLVGVAIHSCCGYYQNRRRGVLRYDLIRVLCTVLHHDAWF